VIAPQRLRLALIGLGKMGRAVAQLAPERDFDVVAALENPGDPDARFAPRQFADADVAIEFTEPAAAPQNAVAALDAGVPIVVGTTGWYDYLPMLEHRVESRGGALLYAPNFSIGVNLFVKVILETGRLLASLPGFDAHLVETHHAAKKDAPSGTALLLEQALRLGLGRETPITSIRMGSVPGTHELLLDAPFETLTLSHVARDRRVFAEGALLAARWLVGRRGVYTMRDVLTAPDSTPNLEGR